MFIIFRIMLDFCDRMLNTQIIGACRLPNLHLSIYYISTSKCENWIIKKLKYCSRVILFISINRSNCRAQDQDITILEVLTQDQDETGSIKKGKKRDRDKTRVKFSHKTETRRRVSNY